MVVAGLRCLRDCVAVDMIFLRVISVYNHISLPKHIGHTALHLEGKTIRSKGTARVLEPSQGMLGWKGLMCISRRWLEYSITSSSVRRTN